MRVIAIENLAEVGQNLHFNAVFFGAERHMQKLKNLVARLIDDGALEPLGGFFGGLDAERLHEQVARGLATVGVNLPHIQVLAVNLEDYAQESVKC